MSVVDGSVLVVYWAAPFGARELPVPIPSASRVPTPTALPRHRRVAPDARSPVPQRLRDDIQLAANVRDRAGILDDFPDGRCAELWGILSPILTHNSSVSFPVTLLGGPCPE